MHGAFADVTPIRRNITIDDVGGAAVFLCSDLSSGVSGEVMYVDGGFNVLGVPTTEG
jgi:enoyl-[acyl-carrier protein] reductase I